MQTVKWAGRCLGTHCSRGGDRLRVIRVPVSPVGGQHDHRDTASLMKRPAGCGDRTGSGNRASRCAHDDPGNREGRPALETEWPTPNLDNGSSGPIWVMTQNQG